MNRRTFLATVPASVGLAGCLDDEAGDDGSDGAPDVDLPDRSEGFATPAPPAFDEPDEVQGGVEAFRGVPFEETPETTLELDLLLPEGDGPHPLVVHVHGGVWEYGDRSAYEEWHPEHGIAGATIDYRLAGTATYPAPVRDVVAAVTWLRRYAADATGIDPERVALRGGSAGAHLAALVATAPDVETFAPVGLEPEASGIAALSGISGMYDLTAEPPDGGETDLPLFPCTLSECPDDYQEASPMGHVDSGDPPAFLWHGTEDVQIPVEASREFDAALRDAGVSSTLVTPEGAGHVVQHEQPWREDFREDELAFLETQL